MRRTVVTAVAVAATAAATAAAAPASASNRAPSSPTLVSPADGHRFEHLEPQGFQVSSVDPDGDVYTAMVTVRDGATGEIAAVLHSQPTPSGDLARATAVPPLPEGSYTWSAHATDVFGADGLESAARGFDVGRPAVAGSGAFAGRVDYNAPGLPPGSCVATQFTVTADSEAAIVDAAVVGFLGGLTFQATGSSACEDKSLGSGPLTASVTGLGATGSTISCPTLTGTFNRVATAFAIEVSGSCHINGFPVGPTSWTLTAEALSREVEDPTMTWTRESRFDGGLTVRSLRQQ